MLVSAKCKCSNKNTTQFVEYDGCLGYEAIVCRKCGRYSDHNGQYESDEWSKQYTGVEK